MAGEVRTTNERGHRVVPAGVERVAAQQPPQRQPAAAQQAEALDRLGGVGAAGRAGSGSVGGRAGLIAVR